MSISDLEDLKFWGLLPREAAYISGQVMGGLALVALVAGVITGQWWFFIATAIGLGFAAVLFKLAHHLRMLAYSSLDEST
ncbi:hypothetical protein [Frondihabitans sucicola]|uniref:hypothetical protein n=1 Tax=Frondihabitans sucicola TaxID=1268041 RepID=UPI002573A217|nr:hypothetical protein [Frondihabitans sucicola]